MDLKNEIIEYMEEEVENGHLENAKLRWGLIGSVIGSFSSGLFVGFGYVLVAFMVFFILNFLAWRSENPMKKAMRNKQ